MVFLQKTPDFLQKSANISKIKGFLTLKGIFSETKYVVVLTSVLTVVLTAVLTAVFNPIEFSIGGSFMVGGGL